MFHILMLLILLSLAGCRGLSGPETPGSGLVITVRFDDPAQTKSTPADGEVRFNENIIKSVDFFFYQGETPDSDADAAFHARFDPEDDPVAYTGGQYEASFNLVLKKTEADKIFTAANSMKATVYAVVNYDGALVSGDSLDGTSPAELAAIGIVNDFAATETAYLQKSFLMDGKTVVTYDESATPSASGVIEAKRFAAKMTTAVHVDDEILLKHRSPDDPDEKWTPVLHTMRIYLVDGAKTVSLGVNNSADNQNPEFFTYGSVTNKRPFVKDSGETYLNMSTYTSGSEEKSYYNTYPMYSFPMGWTTGIPEYAPNQTLHDQPYFKLEMDWRREEYNGYTYDRRKYYYKIPFPVNSLERNNWYHFNIDIGILGSETDEGKATIMPTCYILDWQNRTVPIDKYAVISKARYLSVDTNTKKLNNIESLSIPFLSSHDVIIDTTTIRATRPYYGNNPELDVYNDDYHATIKEDAEGHYYLDYTGQPAGNEKYEPSRWLTNTTSSIEFHHELNNDFGTTGFDYSPYTIEFDIVHDDLKKGVYPYDEYLKHITIIQYPGIFIESKINSDTAIRDFGNKKAGYEDGKKPWLDKPWGYVFIDNGRFLRTGDSKTEDYNKLTTDNNKREYQWRTVWYTGGGRDMFKINVTVLPNNSEFVIGDPRTSSYDYTEPVLGYSWVNDGTAVDNEILGSSRTGQHSNFTSGPVVNGDINTPMELTGETRPLMYYRPTEKSARTMNMLAPAYRISTKLGGTEYGDITEEYAKYRCACYQEDGYPGGRWRLPTKGEIKFIAQLSERGVFEFLFNHDGIYWSANGAVKVGKNNVSLIDRSEALLRCVYDSWYWGDEQWGDRWQFVWGDRE